MGHLIQKADDAVRWGHILDKCYDVFCPLFNPIIWWIATIISLLFNSWIVIDPWAQFYPHDGIPQLLILQIALFCTAWSITTAFLFDWWSQIELQLDNQETENAIKTGLITLNICLPAAAAASCWIIVTATILVSFACFAWPYLTTAVYYLIPIVTNNFKLIILSISLVALTICCHRKLSR